MEFRSLAAAELKIQIVILEMKSIQGSHAHKGPTDSKIPMNTSRWKYQICKALSTQLSAPAMSASAQLPPNPIGQILNPARKAKRRTIVFPYGISMDRRVLRRRIPSPALIL